MTEWIVIGRQISRKEHHTLEIEHICDDEGGAKELSERLVAAHTFISAECPSEGRKYSSKTVKAWLDSKD
jgi:hypothetical protein